MNAEIIRVEKGDAGSFGVLLLDGQAFCVTLELPWRNNAPNISSIPTGKYTCQRTASPLVEHITGGKWKETFEIMGAPGRNRILIHPGNSIADSRGCVLLAQYFGKLRGDRAILNSGQTFSDFMLIIKNINAFGLTIKEAV